VNNIGLVIGAGLACGGLVLGLALLLVRDPPVRLIGGIVIALSATPIIWTVMSAYRTGFVDLNPRVTDAQVVGRWRCEAGLLELNSDGSFLLGGELPWAGRWSRYDWNLSLRDDRGRKEYWRVVTFSKVPVLLREWTEPSTPMPPECRRVVSIVEPPSNNALQQTRHG
jgi:hypothetical protein